MLAERYEIVEVLESDALVCTYRCVDQESNAAMLVRCTAPGLLGERDARRMVERAKPLVGGGGRVLSALRDVDREGNLVFTVEAWPRGTSLRAVLDSRRHKTGTLEPREVLPVMARLGAALASIPEPYWHGDVRPERIWLDSDGLVLTGGFLVSALPGDAIAAVLKEDVGLRRRFAPEVGEGLGGRASDRWGVAAIAWESLTGRAVEPGSITFPDALGAAAKHVAKMLQPDPALRPPTLEALVASIAETAKMPVPRVELDPFPTRATPSDDAATQVAASRVADDAGELPSQTERAPARRSVPPVKLGIPRFSPPTISEPPTERSIMDTMETAFDPRDLRARDADSLDDVTNPATRPLPTLVDDTAPHAALDSDGIPLGGSRGEDLDPRLVRAALADEHSLDSQELEVFDESRPKVKLDDLHPGLARAALEAPPAKVAPKPRGRSSNVTQELDAADLQPLREGLAAKAKKPESIRPPAGLAASQPQPAPARAASPAPSGRKRPVVQPEPVALPSGIKGIPRPRTRESGEMAAGPVLFDASRPSVPMPAPLAAPSSPPAARPGSAGLAAASPGAPTYVQKRTAVMPSVRRGPPAWASWVIVVGAVVIGLAIVAGGFWYRAVLKRESDQQQWNEQRLRDLRLDPQAEPK